LLGNPFPFDILHSLPLDSNLYYLQINPSPKTHSFT